MDRKLKPNYLKISPSSTVVEYSTPNPKTEGSNPAAVTRREREKGKKKLLIDRKLKPKYLKIESSSRRRQLRRASSSLSLPW
jgi:hypothetical protein